MSFGFCKYCSHSLEKASAEDNLILWHCYVWIWVLVFCSHLTIGLRMTLLQGVSMIRRITETTGLSQSWSFQLCGPMHVLIVSTSPSKDFCTASKAGSWAPSPGPNWVTPQSMPSYSAWLQTWLFYPQVVYHLAGGFWHSAIMADLIISHNAKVVVVWVIVYLLV